MGRLKTVAGSQIQDLLEAVNTEILFVTLCAFQVSPELGAQVREARCFPRDCKQSSARPYWSFFLTIAIQGRWSWKPSPTGDPIAGNHCSGHTGEGSGPDAAILDLFSRPCCRALPGRGGPWPEEMPRLCDGDISLPCLQPLPSCLRFVQTNISHLLQDTSEQLLALKPWITRRNFSQCLELQCQPGKGSQ